MLTATVAKAPSERTPLGDRVRTLRTAAGLTQKQLAERLEVSTAYVAGIETKKLVNPTLSQLQKLAGALGCTVVDLVSGVPTIPSRN